MESGFDLGAYLERIGHGGPLTVDLDTLTALHRAHAFRIPFENLDVQMGRPIRLDVPSLQRKLVGGRRGGYCFEQNTLFLAALKAVGFDVVPCEARVRPPGAPVLPRTHMALVAHVGAHPVLCDVGFGGDGPVEPVPLTGDEVQQVGDVLRIAEEGPLLVLQGRRSGEWVDQYAFLPEERYAVDFEVASWFTSTHPESRFRKTLTAQRIGADGRHILRGLTYAFRCGEASTSCEIPREALVPLLRDVFGIDVPEDSRFEALDGPL